jgi:hypothetical protein
MCARARGTALHARPRWALQKARGLKIKLAIAVTVVAAAMWALASCAMAAGPVGHYNAQGEWVWDDGTVEPPATKAINHCIFLGSQNGRNHGNSQNDWLLFCMQQAGWHICENCRADYRGHPLCGAAGTNALYQVEC